MVVHWKQCRQKRANFYSQINLNNCWMDTDIHGYHKMNPNLFYNKALPCDWHFICLTVSQTFPSAISVLFSFSHHRSWRRQLQTLYIVLMLARRLWHLVQSIASARVLPHRNTFHHTDLTLLLQVIMAALPPSPPPINCQKAQWFDGLIIVVWWATNWTVSSSLWFFLAACCLNCCSQWLGQAHS